MGEPAVPFLGGQPIPAPLWRELRAAYSLPGRHYHDARHLDEVLARFTEVEHAVGWQSPSEALLALLFHDVVYVPARHDNEAESALAARAAIARWLGDRAIDGERVAALILLTARHGALTRADVDGDAARFADCDMSILGAAPDRFDGYERDVAREYAAVPPELYAAGRRHFLERVLASERIFLSDYFHDRLDGAARANLRRTLAG